MEGELSEVLVFPGKLDREKGGPDAGDEGLRCGVELRKGRWEEF